MTPRWPPCGPRRLRWGCRHADTAQVQGNEATVGAAKKATGVDRDGNCLTTKVWVTACAEADFLPSVGESLKELGIDHVDLLLLHWPHGSATPARCRSPS
nr:aldo/keto reductase [Oceanicola sp. S124]